MTIEAAASSAGANAATTATTDEPTPAPAVPPAAEPIATRWLARVLTALTVSTFALALWSRRWNSDDGFINFRIVENLLDGHGPVFNIGDRVEAGTSQLWLLVLAVGESVVGRWVELEWIAVVSGIACSVGAVAVLLVALGRYWRSSVVPVGLLGWISVAAVWDFSTSGLEMPLLWLWQAGCFAALLDRSTKDPVDLWRPWWLPVLIGLGPLIRPDAAVYSLCFALAALALSKRSWAGVMRAAVLAALIPVGYQAFRMAFFAALVPNTAIAKEAGDAVWSRGWEYGWDLVGVYQLWIPALAIVAIAAVLLVTRSVQRRTAFVWVSAWVAAALHAIWVIRIGGDFMHARLLLPDWFLLVMPIGALPIVRLRTPIVAVATVVLVGWSAWSFTSARAPLQSTTSPGVYDERTVYVAGARNHWPVTLEDHSANSYVQWGLDARRRADNGDDVILRPSWDSPTVEDTSRGGTFLVWPSIGMVGFAAGQKVYVVDSYGLADTIAARLTADVGRAGHSKSMSPAWIDGRFLADTLPFSPAAAAARRTLACPPMQRLIDSTTSPLTPKLLAANTLRSFDLTRMRIPADPVLAERELC